MSERTEVLQVRLTHSEKKAFETAASISGVTVSAWARLTLRRASNSEIRSVGAIATDTESSERLYGQ